MSACAACDLPGSGGGGGLHYSGSGAGADFDHLVGYRNGISKCNPSRNISFSTLLYCPFWSLAPSAI